jgi:RNA polymerase sigma factor (sigma-70 family)
MESLSERDKLFHDYHGLAINLATRFCRRVDFMRNYDIDDACQVARIALLKAADRYVISETNGFASFAISCISNALAKVSRDDMRKKNRIGTSDAANIEAASKDRFSSEDGEELQAILDAIHPEYRDILEVYFLEGLKQEEIASILGVTRTAVNQRIAKAIEHARLASEADVYLEGGIPKRGSDKKKYCKVCGKEFVPKYGIFRVQELCKRKCWQKQALLANIIKRRALPAPLAPSYHPKTVPFSAQHG